MATSILFDGIDDKMVYGGAPAYPFGTMLIVAKILAADGPWMSFIETQQAPAADKLSFGRYGLGGNQIYCSNGATIDNGAAAITAADGWLIVAVQKPTGSVVPTFNKIPVGGSRSTNAGVVALANAAASDTYIIAGDDDPANMEVACAALFSTILTGAQLDGINAAKTSQSILDLTPIWMVDASDGLIADQVGAIDRTAVTGTAPGSSDPAGWLYLGSTPAATAYPAPYVRRSRRTAW